MAILEQIDFKPMHINSNSSETGGIDWVESKNTKGVSKLPAIFFDDGEPWGAANEYAISKLTSTSGNDIKTVTSNMNHLKSYASWLESEKIDWRHFPKKKGERCLFRYRGHLIEQRSLGLLSPSTVTSRMSAVVRFYRWAQVYGWIEKRALWEDKQKIVQFYTSVGFSRSMSVQSSELAIPNRKRQGACLEDGLLPMTVENRDLLIKFLQDYKLVELYLMAMIGCFTGARSETIRTLRLSTLEKAAFDPNTKQLMNVYVGPGTKVKTKFGVSGHILMPCLLFEELERYSMSGRRLTRQARASEDNQTLLFLTEQGNPYSETTFTKLISSLRKKMVSKGLSQFKHFKFHQTRATFGTQLMTFALEHFSSQLDALTLVRDAMLHKDESTTWKYIRFIENQPAKERFSDEFFNLFSGKAEDVKKLISQSVYDDIS